MEQRQARAGAAFLIWIVALGALVLAAVPLVARADEGVGPVTNLPLPRYVSLRSDKVNARRGPGPTREPRRIR